VCAAESSDVPSLVLDGQPRTICSLASSVQFSAAMWMGLNKPGLAISSRRNETYAGRVGCCPTASQLKYVGC